MSTARRTALVSLVAAVVLVVVKAAVGFASGSLGVLAEAAHSGIDAVAAVLTLYAVGVAERPPDQEHPYGHGKAQHLAALAEAAFLAGAAVWIAVEAVVRLRSGTSPVDARPYVFAVMVFVLAVDASRATLSLRQGRRERNAALIANAWHFGSDFIGTLAVLAGLGLAALGVPGGDSVAAIFVAAIVLVAAIRLAAGNVGVLMDRSPSGQAGVVERAVRSVAGVADVRSVRVREAGGESFADVVIGVSRLEGLEKMHDTSDRVEQAVRDSLGRAQVQVHVEPAALAEERPNERVAAAALRVPGVVEAHNITVLEDSVGRAVTLHVRLPEDATLRQAAAAVERLKREILAEVGIARVYAHVEPSAPDAQPARDVSDTEPDLRDRAAAAVAAAAGKTGEVVVYRQGRRLLVVTSLTADPDLSVRDGHALASRVEDAVRDELEAVDDVIVEVR
ncbi:MAG TPA: cation diffusion facilitator family transporter [Gaiellales bacterium]|nr:cation diffusion facilitator family transporter [Gaiellales bacterium]